jgi:hypothetical protein
VNNTINILFVGSAAQSWYNQEYNTIQTLASWGGIASYFLAPITFVGTWYGIAALAGKFAEAIAVIIGSAGFTISYIQNYMGNGFLR